VVSNSAKFLCFDSRLLRHGSPFERYFDASNNDLTGPIPDNFLINSANTNASVAIYLQNNELTGTVPSELERFEFLDIDLAGNRIEWIPEDLCKIDGWMQGNSKFVGNCSAILCPKGTFNQFGHQTPESRCLPCSHLDDTAYLGNTNCEEFSSERETLSQLFAATGGEFWKENESWQSDAPICSWSRIRCEDGDLQDNQGITTIQLDENDLFGTLPSVVWTLPALRHFSASGNPNLNVDLIDLVRAADTLEALRLSNVHILALDGISGASSLRFLHISDNLLKGKACFQMKHCLFYQVFVDSLFPSPPPIGTFPAELFRLSNTLESLYMSQNLFFGTLPTMVGRLTNLKTFDAFSNDFLSTMPTELGALKDLEALGKPRLDWNELYILNQGLTCFLCFLSTIRQYSLWYNT
jgi:Leucine-rich repeat (LRR) protein